MQRLTKNNVLSLMEGHDKPFKELFTHGSLSIEFYKPEDVDKQEPHTRDEIYVIASGSGTFVKAGKKHKFEAEEVLFVPAGVEHYFEVFSDDFTTWVFFYGPEGGEAAMNPDSAL